MVTSGYGPRTVFTWLYTYGVIELFAELHMDLWDACTGIVRAPHGNLQCFSYPTCRCSAHAGPARVPYNTFRYIYGNWHNQNLQKSGTGLACGCTGPVWAPHRLFMGCLRSLNPYRACKRIMHALKLCGSCTGRQNSYGAVQGPYRPHEWMYAFCSEQPWNSLYGAQ